MRAGESLGGWEAFGIRGMLEIEDAVAIEEGLGVGLGEGLGICLGSAVDCSGLDLIAVCVGVGLDVEATGDRLAVLVLVLTLTGGGLDVSLSPESSL